MITTDEILNLIPPIPNIPNIYAHNIVIKAATDTVVVNIYFTIYSYKESIYSIDELDLLLNLSIGANIEHNNSYMSKQEVGFVKDVDVDNKTIYFYNVIDNDPDDYVGLGLDSFHWTVYDHKYKLSNIPL